MKIYEELVARGLIAQVTNEQEIREMVNNGKATFYIGFDPTADSLHVGHFMIQLHNRWGHFSSLFIFLHSLMLHFASIHCTNGLN